MSIKVRGTGTVTAGSDPLYVIDGIPQSDLASDATGTSIKSSRRYRYERCREYRGTEGCLSRGYLWQPRCQGVIIITTKQGKPGRPKVNYNGYYGWQRRTKKISMLNAYEFARLCYDGHNEAYLDLLESKGIAGSIEDDNQTRLAKMGAKPGTTNVTYLIPPEIMPYVNGEQGLTDTDWQDEIFRNGMTTKHSLSVSGGQNGVDYFISGNYAKEDGIVIGSGQETFGGRANINVKYQNVTFGANTSIAHILYDIVPTEDRFTKETIPSLALAMAPIFPYIMRTAAIISTITTGVISSRL